MATRRNVTGSVNTTGRTPIQYPPEPEFTSNLTSSLIPWASVWTITYSRATTATVTDHEWVIRYVKSGEARFQGARRVENLFSYSEDASNGYWNKQRASVTANAIAWPSGNLIADLVVGTIAGTSYIYAPMSVIAGNKYRVSVSVKAADVTNFNITSFTQAWSCAFDLAAWTAAAATGIASNPTIVSQGNGWYKCSLLLTANATGSNNIGFVSQSYVWNICYVCEMQMEDVTGQSDTSFGGYVSTNVLNSIPYHGANVDGVKYFDTDINGTPIPASTLKGYFAEWARTNICNYSDLSVAWWGLIWATRTNNAWIAPDGTNSFVKIIPDAGTQSSYAYNVNVTTAASVYTISCYVKADWLNFVQLRFGAGISSGLANFDLLNWVVGTRSLWTSSGIEPVAAFPWVYRIWSVTNTVLAATAAIAIQIVPAANSVTGAAVTWDWVSGVMAWGMQIELWPNVSSYIPTTTVAVTRNIDVLTYDVRNVIANQWAFSAVFSMNDNEIFDRRALNLSSFTVNRLHVQLRTLWIPNVGIVYWDGVTVRSVIGVAAWTNNIAVSWKNWVWLNLYMNNIKYIGNFVPSLAFTIIDVGGGVLWYPIFWCTKNLRVWKTVPTDAELLSLSNQS